MPARAFGWVVLSIACLLVAFFVAGRRYLYPWIAFQSFDTTRLSELADVLAPSETVVDDYYTIQRLDEDTIAIGEPRYWQQNFSYLIIGDTRAILFDSGSHVRNIRSVVDGLTSLPVTVFPSHLHYDHVGNISRFDRTALIDLPPLRKRTHQGLFSPSLGQHMGYCEGLVIPTWRVTEWWSPNREIDLGSRVLKVLNTPGHTPDSAMLFDPDRGQLFAGDFLYEGDLYAFLPGSSLESYAATVDRLIAMLPGSARVFSAHRASAPGAPELAVSDLKALRDTLQRVRSGEAKRAGFFPARYDINDRLAILADHPLLQDWGR